MMNGVFSLLLSLHIISVICWFAGLFYLPRLFVYHAMTQERAVFEQLKVMEYRLYYYIMHPSMLATLITGVALIVDYCYSGSLATNGFAEGPLHSAFWLFLVKNWLAWKLLLVVFLIIFHVFCGKYLKIFKQAKTPAGYKALKDYRAHKFFRIFNEIPTVILIAIVFLVVVKP